MEPSGINPLISAYNAHDFGELSEGLSNKDNRIQFEKWCIDNFSEEPDFEWQTRVITLLCSKTQQSQTTEVDPHLSKLISKAITKDETGIKTANKIDMIRLIAQQAPNELKLAAALKGDEENTPIQQAISEKNIEFLKLIAKYAPDEFKAAMTKEYVDENEEGYSITTTPIPHAISEKNIEFLKLIAEYAPDEFKAAMTTKDSRDRTPALEAVEYRELELLKFMAEAAPSEFKAAITTKDSRGMTPALAAVENWELDFLKFMVEVAPDEFKAAMTTKDSRGVTPALAAVTDWDTELLKFMAAAAPDEFKAAMTIKNSGGMTPIHAAAKNGDLRSLKFIAETAPDEFKAIMTMEDSTGEIPAHAALFEAASSGSLELLRLIVPFVAPDEFKGALTIKGKYSNETLIESAITSNNTELIKLIAKHAPDEFKAAITMKDMEGNTPIHTAVAKKRIEMLMFMKETATEEFKLAMGIENNQGETPMTLAAEELNMPLIVFLSNVDPGSLKLAMGKKDSLGNTLLHHAANKDNLGIVKFLAKHAPAEFKASLIMKGKWGMTPIVYAVGSNNIEMLEFMESQGPNEFKQALSMQNKFGTSPISHGSPEILKFIIEKAPEEVKAALKNTSLIAKIIPSKDNAKLTALIIERAKEAPEEFREALVSKQLLHLAVNKNNVELVRFIANSYPDEFKAAMGIFDIVYRNTPIHLAAFNTDIEILEVMKKEAPIELKKMLTVKDDERGERGDTALHLAVLNNNEAMVQFLAKAYPEEFKLMLALEGSDGVTPFYMAVQRGKVKIAECMFDEAQDVCLKALSENLLNIASQNPEICMLLFRKAPDQFKTILTRVLNEAIFKNNIEMVKFIAKEFPEEFKLAITSKNEQGQTLVHKAAEQSDGELCEFIFKLAPAAFETTLTMKDNSGMTPISLGISSSNDKIILLASPKALKEAMMMKDEGGMTPLHWAAHSKKIECIVNMAEKAPEEFKTAMLMQDDLGLAETPVMTAMNENNTEALKIFEKMAHVEFKKALLIKNEAESTVFHLYAANKNAMIGEILTQMANDSPDEFKSVISMPNNSGKSPIDLAIQQRNIPMVQLAAKAAPDELKAAINAELRFLSIINNLEIMKIAHEMLPKEFKETMKKKSMLGFSEIQNIAGIAFRNEDRPMLEFLSETMHEELKAILKKDNNLIKTVLTKDNPEMLKFFADNFPEEFTKELKLESNVSDADDPSKRDSQIHALKAQRNRPRTLKEITKLFKNDPGLAILRNINKESVKRKAIGHAFDLSGNTELINTNSEEVLESTKLTGHFSPEWFHKFLKDLKNFEAEYSNLLKPEQKNLLTQAFNLGANPVSFSTEDKLKMIANGEPVILDMGFRGHTVTGLIFKGRFIICNRGDATRQPLEIYHFNPLNFDKGVLDNIENVNTEGTKDDYATLFFQTLPKKLNFTQTDLDQQLEWESLFPNQTVGNCSFVSAITSVYALLLLSNDNESVFEQAKVARGIFQTWLGFEQLAILERAIAPSSFKPDHKLIRDAYRKAHLLPLDEKGRKKLAELTESYINSLSEKERREVETDLIYWKSLSYR